MSKSESLKEMSIKTPKLNLIDLSLPNKWFIYIITNNLIFIIKLN